MSSCLALGDMLAPIGFYLTLSSAKRPKEDDELLYNGLCSKRKSFACFFKLSFLPRDATQCAVTGMPQYVVRPSVCLSVTYRYRDHIG